MMNRFSSAGLFLILFPGTVFTQIRVTDDAGRSVVLQHHARRIVSLAPSITETLFALGAGDQVVGVTDFCNYPPEALTKERIGGVINPSIEAVTALDPDLILVSMEGNARESFERFEQLHETVFVTNPRSVAGIYRSISDVALLCGLEENGKALLASLRAREEVIRNLPTPLTSVMLLVSVRPLILVGTGTFLSEVLSIAGGVNVASGTGQSYPTFSREAIIAANPEVIIVTDGLIGGMADLLVEYPEWKDLAAIREMRVFTIDADIASRPGPRVIDAVEEVSRMVRAATTERTSSPK